MYEFIWFFLIYSFLGWCAEVCYAAVITKGFVNRGFLNGPYCPIYGFGVVLVVSLLQPLRTHLPLLFLGAVVVTSALELAVGFLLEKLFHQRWWDYSDQPFHLKGFICPGFSLMWGAACLVVVEIIHPAVLWVLETLPRPLDVVLMTITCVVMAVDTVVSIRGIHQLSRDLDQIESLAERIREISDGLGENLAERVKELSEKTDGLKENLTELREGFADWKDDAARWREEWSENWMEMLAELREDFSDWKDNLTERAQDWKEEHLHHHMDHKEHSHEELRQLKEKLEALTSRTGKAQKRLLRAFPSLRFSRHTSAMKWLRRKLGDKR